VIAVRASEAIERVLTVVERAEPVVRAWAYLDADRARQEARDADERGDLPLSGVVLGVKDIFDTCDQPAEYGSPLFAGHRPVADAAAVALLRAAGAVCLGKTVTAEFAFLHPGPTTNPHRATHTPGGSSMGSAAAVASGMADIALGTQTAASVIRPASFCGVYGFKPTFGAVSTAGVKTFAPSLDTVGWFARDPLLLDEVRVQLTGRAPMTALAAPPRIGLLRTEQWAACSPDSMLAVEAVAAAARSAGAFVTDVGLPASFVGLADEQRLVMAYEGARSLAWEHRVHRDELSPVLREFLDFGRSVDPDDVDAVRDRRRAALGDCRELFGGQDVLLTPAVIGEAPEGLTSTGDPRLARLWTLLGMPSLSAPAATGSTGMPVGVQFVAPPDRDASLLAVTAWLAGTHAVGTARALRLTARATTCRYLPLPRKVLRARYAVNRPVAGDVLMGIRASLPKEPDHDHDPGCRRSFGYLQPAAGCELQEAGPPALRRPAARWRQRLLSRRTRRRCQPLGLQRAVCRAGICWSKRGPSPRPQAAGSRVAGRKRQLAGTGHRTARRGRRP
jgi:Asp-tRNA(Asn)/Glu-tRNA(Gln) amidotransferase A subunit family amidase